MEFEQNLIDLGVYSLCDGPKLSRGPYLTIATTFSVSSLLFVSFKASYVFSRTSGGGGAAEGGGGGGGGVYGKATEVALFGCSLALAIGHIVVAYRTSCRERRKLLVYKIDIEAVSQLIYPFLSFSCLSNSEFFKVFSSNSSNTSLIFSQA